MSNKAVDLVKRARANWDECIALGRACYPGGGSDKRLTPYICDCLSNDDMGDEWMVTNHLRYLVQRTIGMDNKSAACVVFPDQNWFEVDNFCPEMIAYRNELWDMLILAAEAMDEEITQGGGVWGDDPWSKS